MDRLPLSIICDIFSRVPRKCLACCRCVSKVWCNYINDPYLMIVHDERALEEPIPILYHSDLVSHERITCNLCFHVLESKQTGTGTSHTYVLQPKDGPFLEFFRKKPRSSYVKTEVRGSCNGLMCLSQDEYDHDGVTTLVVVHPLRKECYELPPLPLRWMFGESCGLGFDASTNTLKMVCVLRKTTMVSNNPDVVNKNLYTMVHVFGTNSWREIPQVLPYLTKGEAVFANGCLYWLVSNYHDIKTKDSGRPIICFDVEKEEFGLIDPPTIINCSDDHLVDLNGEVGYVCYEPLEVWALKQKEWVSHCQFEKQIVPYSDDIQVLGCWNKDGDMLIRISGHKFSVYNLKSGVLHETSINARSVDPSIFMHPNKLFSIRGIGSNSFPMKKTDLKNSCQCQFLSWY